jgi:hypothetical protein
VEEEEEAKRHKRLGEGEGKGRDTKDRALLGRRLLGLTTRGPSCPNQFPIRDGASFNLKNSCEKMGPFLG